jgi:hypothetical protein
MDPITALNAVNAALALAEALAPKIKEWTQSGEISKEQQATLQARLASLRTRAGGEFTGPEWEKR